MPTFNPLQLTSNDTTGLFARKPASYSSKASLTPPLIFHSTVRFKLQGCVKGKNFLINNLNSFCIFLEYAENTGTIFGLIYG
jgi:hypothetical protein